MTMSTAKRSDAIAPSLVSSQSPPLRATTVMTAALTPLNTTSVPRIVLRQPFNINSKFQVPSCKFKVKSTLAAFNLELATWNLKLITAAR